ncbi:hypothetical protein EDC18_105183 [Natranaerovirga pectinivora]|uniref:DUF5050 domain-containing protein n=1 Tax=Natranaerovirga pectinivora TaxID=682400 RepID=A0A4R3MKE4_9FIRM|nr:DUF5050 domain-containing protein [Natranaerovirga pectinivora]TCT14701.1 hypothetical protein EDC18_105183 [Natranaerovirga pectinivora]
MGKKLYVLVLLFILSLNLIPTQSIAAEKNVKVQLPKFTVTLNGNVVENEYREYPLLVYKNITYFPMTWYDCRLLGLETKWSQNEGFEIYESKVTSSYVSYKTQLKNQDAYNATIPEFKIKINGKSINNAKEEYPFLVFRDVTYFPLTWKIAHDEFNWDYKWDNAEGLMINSKNPQLETLNLSRDVSENGIMLFEGYYYFVETVEATNEIYRVPKNNILEKELVYSYDLNDSYGFNNRVSFDIRDNELWFSYHYGGAVMGYDVYCKVNDDGRATVEYRGYLDLKKVSNGTLIINQSVPPDGNNLEFLPSDKNQESRRLGDSNLIYGWHIEIDEQTSGFNGNNMTTVIEENVYIMASSYPLENGDLNKIYNINLITNEIARVVDSSVNWFKIIEGKIYYIKDFDEDLYVANLDGTNEQKIIDIELPTTIEWFDIINHNPFYLVEDEEKQFYLYKVEECGEDTLVLKESIERIKVVNNKLVCKLAEGKDYGLKIFDDEGNINLAITDQVEDIFTYEDRIIMTMKDGSIKLLKIE